MSNWKKIIVFLFLFISVGISGCTGNVQNSDTQEKTVEQSTVGLDVGEDETESTDVESKQQITKTHLNKEYGDKFIVDADVVGIQGTTVREYKTAAREIPEQEMLNVFLPEYDENDFETIRDEDYWRVENSTTGESLGIISDTATYLYNNDVYEIWALIKDWIYANGCPEAKDLDFMSKEEAEEFGLDILKKLNISEEFEVDCKVLSLSTAQMKEFNQRWIDAAGEENASMLDFQEGDNQYDAYYLMYTVQMDGIGIYNSLENYTTIDMDTMQLDMMITKEGLMYFNLDNWFEKDAQVLSDIEIISAEEAVDKVYERYDTLSDFVSKVYSVQLQYIASSEGGDDIFIRPYWCVELESNEFGQPISMVEFVNAQTGGDYRYGN